MLAEALEAAEAAHAMRLFLELGGQTRDGELRVGQLTDELSDRNAGPG